MPSQKTELFREFLGARRLAASGERLATPQAPPYPPAMLVAPATFRRLVRAHELLVSDVHDALTVRAIAEQVGLSPFHFIRQFAAVYGGTPHQLRTRARLDRAKVLLAAGLPVTEVCLALGFSSLGSFSTMFTRRVGASPTHYRRSVQVPRNLGPVVVPGCFGLLAELPRNYREATPL